MTGKSVPKLLHWQMGNRPSNLRSGPSDPGGMYFQYKLRHKQASAQWATTRVVVSTDVLESRVRILILAGSPDADLGYLRRVLQDDANLEVDVLVRTLTAGWQRDVHRALRALDERDIVALINAPYEALAGVPEQALVAFVQKGGGLLALGGDAAFDNGYAHSALADILPVQFLGSSDTFQERAFALAFPDSRHPILRVSDDPLSDRDAWEALPPLLSYNRVGAAVSNATVLAHHPTERVEGKPMPVLAIRRVGAGKTRDDSLSNILASRADDVGRRQDRCHSTRILEKHGALAGHARRRIPHKNNARKIRVSKRRGSRGACKRFRSPAATAFWRTGPGASRRQFGCARSRPCAIWAVDGTLAIWGVSHKAITNFKHGQMMAIWARAQGVSLWGDTAWNTKPYACAPNCSATLPRAVAGNT